MKDEVSVSSGEVKACNEDGILRASAVGSCVVVAAVDPGAGVGGMAHVMLPGPSCGQDPSRRTRYAQDAVEEMMRQMAALGADEARVRACLVGGANVLGDGHGSPGPEIIRSLAEILGKTGITTVAEEVGGTLRRSCSLDVARRRVTCAVGDSGPWTLWEAEARSTGPDGNGRRKAEEG